MDNLTQTALRIGEEHQRQYGESGEINVTDWSGAILDALEYTLLSDQVKELHRSYAARQGELVYRNDLDMSKWREIWAAGFNHDQS